MARWGRAAGLLRLPPGSRVLDLGCAFGFGTRLLARRYQTYGHDLNPQYVERARQRLPRATFTHGSADSIPYANKFFDGVLLLDVLEHVPYEGPVIEEIERLLRPGGQLIVSVPNKGLLASLDSLNLYRRLLGDRALAPTDDPSWRESPIHRHYDLTEVQRLLGPHFRILGAHYTGLGLAEVVNLILLLLLRAVPRLSKLYSAAQYLYFGVYLLEDMVPTGSYGYHLMIDAERL